MSDFIYSWIGIAIAVVTLVSILACAWFLKANTTRRLPAGADPGTTGHLWASDDGGDSWQLVAAHLAPIGTVRLG